MQNAKLERYKDVDKQNRMKEQLSQQILENRRMREEHNKRKQEEDHQIKYKLRVQNRFQR